MTFFSFGFGRDLVRSAAVALPTPRDGRSTAFIPPPNLDGPKEEDIETPSLRRSASYPQWRVEATTSRDWMIGAWPTTQYQAARTRAGYVRRLRRAAIKERTQNRT